MRNPLRVGIVGLQPGRSWASRAHVPALRALPDLFELKGVANTTQESSEAAASAANIPIAFSDAAALIRSPEIDVVSVTTRVPTHFEIVKTAIEAGKHIYCEWPLGRTLAEAEEMAHLAKAKEVLAVIGTQAILAPEIEQMGHLVRSGHIGDVLSVTIVAVGGALQGSGTIPDEKAYAYLLDNANGATLLTIPVGHTIAAVRSSLGDVASLSAVIATRRRTALATDTGLTHPVSAPDQVLVSGLLSNGAPISIHYRGGDARDEQGLLWEVNGTKGDIRLTGPTGHTQMAPLALSMATDGSGRFEPVPMPLSELAGWPKEVEPGNVARLYARMAADLRLGTHTAPTLDDAVDLHRVIAAIETAATNQTAISRPRELSQWKS